ncbi:hypothetical protein [Crocosphaera subtropica]|uniref:hypothetical protein n=1 Tax=Crocosphaera subtropica TaxID=2546360 RepID=UPI0012EB9060|nr:hypothetical protein [Crocosphaera subtropica]
MPFNVKRPQEGRIYLESLFDGFYYIGCKGINRHKDGALLPPYVSFLVLRNDGFIAKPYHRPANNRTQPPGSLLLLNIHNYHHVMKLPQQSKTSTGDAWWISLGKDYDTKPSREKMIADFDNVLDKMSFLTADAG